MQSIKDWLLRKIENRTAKVGVIGLGYVGLPLATAFAEEGHNVVGIDVDQNKVDAINRGQSHISDVSSEALAALTCNGDVEDMIVDRQIDVTTSATRYGNGAGDISVPRIGQLAASTDFSQLAECDAACICVPTPLNKTGEPDISHIVTAAEQLACYLHPGMAVVLESTTFPGTTREVLLPILLGHEVGESVVASLPEVENGHNCSGTPVGSRKLEVGEELFLAFSPERIDPGRKDYTVKNTPKVVGGVTSACSEVVSTLYRQAVEEVVSVSSPEAAETVKLFENTFRSVNIGLANELLLMCDRLGIDAWEVVDAASTKPFGFMRFTPGPGLGGHCIPIDPHYLSWKLRTLNYNARFIQLASEVNTEMPRYWVHRIQDALNGYTKAVNGSRILVLGVAYKKDVNDLRESPAIDIIHLLQEKGAHVSYHDPYVPILHYDGIRMECLDALDEALSSADCVVITTDHSCYDWEHIAASSSLIVDTRSALRAFMPHTGMQSPENRRPEVAR